MTPHPTIDAILDTVANRYGVTSDAILSKRNDANLRDAKAHAAALMKRLRGMSQPEIAQALGYQSHSDAARLLKIARFRGLDKWRFEP